jgi:hypothetical protein
MATCRNCGANVPALASVCAHCGVHRSIWPSALGFLAAGVFLLSAAGIAAYVATRPEPLIAPPREADAPAATPSPAAGAPAATKANPAADAAALAEAMKSCDALAAKEKGSMHFLVTPLETDPSNREDWKALALNRIGNAVALSGDDTLGGLRRGTLRIGTAPFVFSVRDEENGQIVQWEPATGIKWASTPDNGAFAAFRMRFKPQDRGRDDDWGNPIDRQAGDCHWINALVDP